MAQHSQNGTIIVADIHMGIGSQTGHTAVDQEEVCSTRHTIYHKKHIHLTCIVTYMISMCVQDVYITCKERLYT